jgi:hypothetical protein
MATKPLTTTARSPTPIFKSHARACSCPDYDAAVAAYSLMKASSPRLIITPRRIADRNIECHIWPPPARKVNGIRSGSANRKT